MMEMKFKSISALKDDRTLVQLKDVLFGIPDNTFVWAILDFYGIGKAPNGLSMEDFESLIRGQPKGAIMSWRQLQEFASGLDQTFDCLIVGAQTQKDISIDRSKKENFQSCEIVIEAFDSTEWLVWAKDNQVLESIETAVSVEFRI